MAYTLITQSDVDKLTKGGIPSGDFDYLLSQIIIPGVTSIFGQYTGRYDPVRKEPEWDLKERTFYLSPRVNQKHLLFNFTPIVQNPSGNPAIPNVQLWQTTSSPRVYGADTLLVNGEDYFVHEGEGIIEHVSGFVGGPMTVKATLTGGYLTASGVGTPADLRLAAIAQTKILFDRREELGVSSRSQEGGAVTMLSVLTLPRQVTMMLDPYRLVRV